MNKITPDMLEFMKNEAKRHGHNKFVLCAEQHIKRRTHTVPKLTKETFYTFNGTDVYINIKNDAYTKLDYGNVFDNNTHDNSDFNYPDKLDILATIQRIYYNWYVTIIKLEKDGIFGHDTSQPDIIIACSMVDGCK